MGSVFGKSSLCIESALSLFILLKAVTVYLLTPTFPQLMSSFVDAEMTRNHEKEHPRLQPTNLLSYLSYSFFFFFFYFVPLMKDVVLFIPKANLFLWTLNSILSILYNSLSFLITRYSLASSNSSLLLLVFEYINKANEAKYFLQDVLHSVHLTGTLFDNCLPTHLYF